MGQIRIEFDGSFTAVAASTSPITFSAEDGGHADAIARTIAFLSGTILPAAIELDHELATGGHYPRKPFGCGNKP